jgi:hypothetical protein
VAPLHIQLSTNYDYYDYIRHVCTQTLVSFFYIIFICTSLPGPTCFLEATWTRGCQGCEDTPLGGDPEHLSLTASNFYSYYLLCVLTPSQSVPFTRPSTLAKLRNLHPTSSITTPSLYYLCVLHPPSTTYVSYTLPSINQSKSEPVDFASLLSSVACCPALPHFTSLNTTRRHFPTLEDNFDVELVVIHRLSHEYHCFLC